MKVKIQSTLTPPANGILEIECEPSSTVGSLIRAFCNKKDVQLLSPSLCLYNLQYQPLKSGATLECLGIKDGATVLLGCRIDAYDVNIMLKWRVIALILCILAVCGLVTVSLLYSLSGGEVPYDYGIVMDAGSTHTQVTLYRWKGDKDKGTGEVLQIDTCKINGGIQNIKNFSEAGHSLLPCMKNLSTSIPENHITATPVYLGATAGMRLLNLTNPSLTDAILHSIHDTLKNHSYDVRFVNIISGKVEGMFAWITANFLSDKLECEQEERISTVGTLDLGGASTQIAYEIEDRKGFKNDTISTLLLYGNKHDIFSKSFLCFGVNEAIRRYHAILVEDFNRTDIDDPCGLRGDTVNYTASYLFGHPCTTTEHSSNWLKSNANYSDKIYFFNGTSDSKGCAKAVGDLMNVTACQETYEYCFEPLHQSLTDVKYMAISTFYYLAKFLKLDLSNSTLDQYQAAMNTFCNMSYQEALNIDPEEAEYVSNFCFEAHYIFYILTEEYGFNVTSWRNIDFVNKINKFNVGWSLGFMINSTTLIPAEKPEPPIIPLTAFVASSLVCLILLLVAAILLIKYCHSKPRSGYKRIAEA